MKKFINLILLCLLFLHTINAQPHITKGTQQKKAAFFQKFLGKIGSKFYYLETDNKKTFLSVFNYALELEKIVELEKPLISDVFYRHKEIIVGDKIYLVGFANNAISKEGYFLVSILNDDLTTMKNWKQFYSLPIGNSAEFFYLKNTKQFLILDKGYLESEKNITLTTIILNDKLEFEKENKNELNFKWKENNIIEEFVTDAGNYIMVGKKDKDDLKIVFNVLSNKLFVYSNPNYLTLNIIENTSQNKLYLAGFYSLSADNLEGIYLYTIDSKTGVVSDTTKSVFSKEFVNNYLTKENEKTGAKIPFHEVKKCFINKEGNIILISQLTKVVKDHIRTQNGSFSSTSVIYRTTSYDILVVCIKPDGKMLWSQIIPRLEGASYEYSPIELENKLGYSFSLYEDEKSLNFIFFDSEKNYRKIKKSNKYLTDVHWSMDGKVNLMKINLLNENGNSSFSVLGGTKDFGYLVPTKCSVINNEFILYNLISSTLFSWGDKYRLDKFKF